MAVNAFWHLAADDRLVEDPALDCLHPMSKANAILWI
jgi:hypothetical protein